MNNNFSSNEPDANLRKFPPHSPLYSSIFAFFKQYPVTTFIFLINIMVFATGIILSQINFHLSLLPVLAFNEPYRLLTTTFIHANILHLLFNMLAFLSIAPTLEINFGKLRFTLLYIISAIGGSLIVIWLLPNHLSSNWLTQTVGASGAIFGLFAGYLVVERSYGLHSSNILGLIIINFIISFTLPGISWEGHIGGFLAGLLLAGLFYLSTKTSNPSRNSLIFTALVAMFLIGLFFLKLYLLPFVNTLNIMLSL